MKTSVQAKTLPIPLRAITWVVVGSQVLTPLQIDIRAATKGAAETAERKSGGSSPASPVTNVVVNRTVPTVTPPSTALQFSDTPTDQEIMRARVFSNPLVPMGRTTAEENKALARAIAQFLNRTVPDDDSAFVGFLGRFPESAWKVSLLTELGIWYRYTGYFTKALKMWEEAWAVGKDSRSGNREIIDHAAAELAELNARLGRFERLEPLLQEIAGREIGGAAAQKITGAREGLWLMDHEPEKAFRCGPMALQVILKTKGVDVEKFRKIEQCFSTRQGISLLQVAELAKSIGFDYVAAQRKAGAKLVVPCIIHWKAGHYAALTKAHDGKFLVQDPTFGTAIWVTQRAIDEEASGYFLAPATALGDGLSIISEETASKVWGKGATSTSDPRATGKHEVTEPDCPPATPMAQYVFHAMAISLSVFDAPVGYTPPRGPAVTCLVTYNQREYNQPSTFLYSNFGKQWVFDWQAFVKDDPTTPLANVEVYLRGGGYLDCTDFDTGSQAFAVEQRTNRKLVRTSATSYRLEYPDGSQEVYDVPDAATNMSPRRVFISKAIDPSGNALTFTYDAYYRLVAVTDAIAQVTTLAYASTNISQTNLFYKITKVTDPFGRFATFDYNGSFQLIRITDILGLTSEFTYGTGDKITSMTTPYGTTTFDIGESGRTRWIEATDPLGQRERIEYQDTRSIPSTEFIQPGGVTLDNGNLSHRNTYYWDKKAMAEGAGDYSKAKVTHWLHLESTSVFGQIESYKKPLENRVWYTYPGQGFTYFPGTNSHPATISRVLDDGTTQTHRYQNNVLGKVMKYTDPSGRATTNVYSTNLIDLLEVRQVTNTTTELLGKFTYSTNHLPLTFIDAAGRTNSFGYNTNGQIIGLTNALQETVTMGYDTNGYLTNITGSVAGATTGLTYDSYGRVRTITDSQGYAVTNAYDAGDRVTRITYPDGTYEEMKYERLDLVAHRDRLGRWTQSQYNGLRQVTLVQDALGRLTRFDWCGCGSLGSITDPMGRMTSWIRDIQGRVTAKVYPDLTTVAYTYENTTSRLKEMTDAKAQRTSYTYFVDDNLQLVNYPNQIVGNAGVAFTYEPTYNRIATMVDTTGTNTYTYYAVSNAVLGAGRLASIDGPLTNDTISYSYDELGRVKSRAINDVAQKVTYDVLGRVTVVTNILGSFTNSYVSNTFRLSLVEYPNGQKSIFNYFGNTNDQRLEEIKHITSASNIISKFNYTYDAEGQIATWTQQAGTDTPKVWEMGYDVVNQLLSSMVRSNSISGSILKKYLYAYDTAGNRIGEQIDNIPSLAQHNNVNQLTNLTGGGALRFKGYLNETGTVTVAGGNATIVANTNFLGSATTIVGTNVVAVIARDLSSNKRTNNYEIVVTNNGVAKILSYDLNGNLGSVVSETNTTTYTWDAADRLIKTSQSQPSLLTEFTYDGLGRRTRIVERTNGVIQSDKRFVWCGTELCEERDSTGATVNKRFFGQGEQISGTTYFFTRDHLGSIREMTDSGGSVQARYEFDPYGRRTKVSGSLDSDFAFTGHYYHQASGLHLALYRAFDAETGRWISRDPIGNLGGLNLYGYAFNNPLNLLDPDGLAPNQAGTTNPEHLLRQVRVGAAKGYTTEQTLKYISEGHVGNINRYFYTDKYGWIDVRHFAEGADFARDYGSVVTETLGFGQEAWQWATEWGTDYRSGFSCEDLPSNKAGAEFGDDYINKKESLESALGRWLKDAGARQENDPKAKRSDLPATDPSIRKQGPVGSNTSYLSN